MKILHATWIPQNTDEYEQNGAFYLWVETIAASRGKKAKKTQSRCPKPSNQIGERVL